MKLLFCSNCEDIVKLWPLSFRSCKCRLTKGRLAWDKNTPDVVYDTEVEPSILDIDGTSLGDAIRALQNDTPMDVVDFRQIIAYAQRRDGWVKHRK